MKIVSTDILILEPEDLSEEGFKKSKAIAKFVLVEDFKNEVVFSTSKKSIAHHNLVMYVDRDGDTKILKNRCGGNIVC
jgi:hypothetical protein